MKNTFLTVLALVCIAFASSAQSTVDSIKAKYKLLPMPEPLSVQKTFPVIGSYQLSNAAEGGAVTVRLDSLNKGIVWVDGLPQGTFKAYLKKAPATYRILAQKSASGKSIPEGTLYFDPVSNVLNIALGVYNEADPVAIFPTAAPAVATDVAADVTAAPVAAEAKVKVKTDKSKKKAKVTFYTATKVDAAATASSAPVAQ